MLNWCDPDKKKKKRLFDLEPYHTIAEKQRLGKIMKFQRFIITHMTWKITERRPNQDTPEKENEETKESDKVPAENTQSAQTKPKEEPDESKLVAVSPTKRSHDEMEAQNEGDVVAQPQAPLLSKRARRDPKDKKGCIMS